jgi:hypothetical protein
MGLLEFKVIWILAFQLCHAKFEGVKLSEGLIKRCAVQKAECLKKANTSEKVEACIE